MGKYVEFYTTNIFAKPMTHSVEMPPQSPTAIRITSLTYFQYKKLGSANSSCIIHDALSAAGIL